MDPPETTEVTDEKCYDAVYLPLGVRSFADADVAHDAHERDEHARETTATFQAIVNNILYADELSADEKAGLIAQAASDMAERVSQPTGMRSLWGKVKALVSPAPKPDPTRVGYAPGGAFTAYRDKATGEPRWIGIWSNTYVDREAERFTEAAHREFESWADQTGKFPDLRLWHEPAAVIGKADSLAYDDNGFMVATGSFNEAGKSLYPGLENYPEPLGMSHGYNYRASDLRNGEYHRYRTFEVSVLPLAAAANLRTAFGLEESMALREDKKRMFSALGGEDFANEIEARIEALAKDDKALPDVLSGLKSLLEGTTAEPPTPPVNTPPDESLKELLSPVMEGITAIKAVLDQHAEAIKELQKSDDEKLSAAWGKSNVAALKALAASSSDESVVDGRKAIVKGAKSEGSQYAEGGLDSYYLNAFTGKTASAVPTE